MRNGGGGVEREMDAGGKGMKKEYFIGETGCARKGEKENVNE